MEIADYVCGAPSTFKLDNLADVLVEEGISNPIDAFRIQLAALLSYGTEERLDQCDFLGRLLVLGIVSAAEGYFRAVIAEVMRRCPLAQKAASEKKINLGGLLWHGNVGLSLSAFDDLSFSSADSLKKGAFGYLRFSLPNSVFKGALDEYENVCNLRHGIVHNDGILPGKNAVQLDIPRYNSRVRIVIRYKRLQDIATVVSTLVTLFNRQLFAEMCKRWATDWRDRSDWEPEMEQATFDALWRTFRSKAEMSLGKGKTALTRGHCMGLVRSTYSLGK